MSLPTSITSASNYDQSSDDPKQARAQLKGLRDDVDAINSHLKTSTLTSGTSVLGVGDGLQATGGNLVVQANGTTLDVSGAGVKLADNPVMPGTSGMRTPEGTTAQRPGQPHSGTLRYNTTTGKLEVFEGGAWEHVIDPAAGDALAWVTFTGSGGMPSITADFNVSSITDNGPGDFTINFELDLPNIDYCLAGAISMGTGPVVSALGFKDGGTRTVSAAQILTKSGPPSDPVRASCVFFGG